MEHTISHDALGTHIDWQHQGITAREIDWFWSNMEKGFILWHPEQHEALEWAVPPKHGNLLGAIHIAPQTWSDGRRQNLYIRFEKLEAVAPEILNYITYEHVIVVAGLGLGEECLQQPDPMGYLQCRRKSGRHTARRRSATGAYSCRSCTLYIGLSQIPAATHTRISRSMGADAAPDIAISRLA